jgi:hypothetical protein
VSRPLPVDGPIPRKGAGVVSAKTHEEACPSEQAENAAASSLKNNYTVVPNAFLRYWLRALKGEYFFLVWVVQGTLGWQAKAGRRAETKATSFGTIAEETGQGRHTVERAAGVLEQIGLICRTGGQGAMPVFSINVQMLQKPPLPIEELVPIVDKLRERVRSSKRDKLDPKRGQVAGPKEDKLAAASLYERKEFKEKENTTTTTEASTFELLPFFGKAVRDSADDDVGPHSLIKGLKAPETQWWFNRLESLLHKPGKASNLHIELARLRREPPEPSALGSKGRLRILQACEKHGFSLGELYFAFKEHRGGLSQSGGLIHFAEDWPVSILGICNWPACYYCVDSGVIEYPDSPFEKEVPCQCEAGKRKLESEKFAGFDVWLQARKEGRFYCHDCCNTGVLRDMPGASFDFPERQFCLCELGRHKLGEWQKRKREACEAELAARAQAREHGICEICFARDPGRGTCVRCNSTGRHFTEEELSTLCSDCKGLRKLKYYKDKECSRCEGTGLARIRQLAY